MSARISVVMPTFNLEQIACRTLATALAQTSLPDEILVVDDGSTDGTVALIEDAARAAPPGLVRVLPGPHRGPGATRNRGIREAVGDWVAFLDGDDLWLPAKIERLRAAIAARPDAEIVAHDEFERAPDGAEIHKPLHERYDSGRPLLPQLYRGCFFSTSCIAVRRDALDAVGGFDETLGSSQDFDLWLKLARGRGVHFIPEALATYILRANSISMNAGLRYECLRRIAYRHAPYLVPLLGAGPTRRLRLRFLAVAQVQLQSALLRSSPLKAVGQGPRLARDLLAAVVYPIDAGAGA